MSATVTTGFSLRAHAATADDPGPQAAIRHGALPARQLYALSAGWPELEADGEDVGLYQAVGAEKLGRFTELFGKLDAEGGYDAQKPAAILLQYLAYGPFCHLAIARGLRGPFQPLEATQGAGIAALLAAIDDLAAGRCRHALVGGLEQDPPWARLIWLSDAPGLRLIRARDKVAVEREAGGLVRWLAPSPDPHGLVAVCELLDLAAAGQHVGLVTPGGVAFAIEQGV